MYDNITFTIKTFLRKNSLVNLLFSIEKFYPGIKVIVLDDSPFPLLKRSFIKKFNLSLDYITTRFNIGSGEARNRILDKVQTEYFVYLDDDFLFEQHVSFIKIVDIFSKYNCDIIGGDCLDHLENRIIKRRFYGNFHKENGVLFCTQSKNTSTLEKCHYVLNFFIAKTSSVRRVGWNKKLKTIEHLDFFYKVKHAELTVLHHPNMVIGHFPKTNRLYSYFRFKNVLKKYTPILKESIGVQRIYIDGKEAFG